jgi:UDP-glucuronate decarboxylase
VYTSNRAIGETLVLLRNVLDVCRENKTRLIYPSNGEVYSAYRTSEIIANEHLPLFPRGPNGETKFLCENLIEIYRKLHGLQCGILRSATIYSDTGDRPKFLYNFISKARRNEPIRTHCYLNGYPKIDLLYVDDFVSALTSVIESGFAGTLNIGSGHAVSTREVAEAIVKKTDSHSIIDGLNIDDYTANITMDITSAYEVLAWQPNISWETGIDRLLGVARHKV